MSTLPTYFDFLGFLSNKYVKLSLSIIVILICLPVFARLKVIREFWFIFKLRSGADVNLKVVRKAVKKAGFIRYNLLYVRIWALNIFWATALLLPSALMLNVGLRALRDGSATIETASIMIAGNVVLFSIGIVAFLCISQRYSLCYWLLIKRDDLSSRQMIKESVRIMDSKCIDFFMFKVSFLFWFLLGIILLPSVIYSYPYYKQACAVYALDLLASRKKCDDATITFELLR